MLQRDENASIVRTPDAQGRIGRGTRVDGVRCRHRRGGTIGALDRDQVAAALRGTRHRPLNLHRREGLRGRRPHSLRRGAGTALARRTVPGLEGARRAAPHPRARGPVPVPHQGRRGEAPHAAADAQRRELHHQPRESLPLAGRAGGGTRCLHISRISRLRGALPRGRRGQGRRDTGHGGGTRRGSPRAASSRESNCMRGSRCSPKAAAVT